MGRLEKAPAVRTRNRINNRTKLRVVDGDVPEAELLFLEEDSDKHKILDASGVEHEDSREEHLVQVLAAANRRLAGGSTRATKSSAEIVTASIPIPDATGIVENYDETYPHAKWADPHGYLKSSATVEECLAGGISGGFTYDMDETDMAWLEKNNSIARGEGSSAQARVHPPPRSVKARGKESTDRPTFAISENEFELAMGLFEKFTEEKWPFLHLDLNGLPSLQDYEPLFTGALVPSLFPNFVIPSSLPDPSHLVRLARAIYPHWKERKIARGGQKIIPQLNYDESHDGDPYVCFRRRDVKAVRKTRRQETTSVDRLTRLKAELASVRDISSVIVSREVKKLEATKEAKEVFDARVKLVELKRKHGLFSTPDDELLFDRPVVKRLKTSDLGAGTIRLSRKPKDSDGISPVTPGMFVDTPNPNETAAAIAAKIERLVQSKKEANAGWEEGLDLPASLNSATPSRFFRTLPPRSKNPPISRSPECLSIRLRRGRGGYTVDRRIPNRVHPLAAPIPPPPQKYLDWRKMSQASSETSDEGDSSARKDVEIQQAEEADREWRTAQRFKFDNDTISADEEQRVVIDDYDTRYLLSRLSTFEDADLRALSIDSTHMRRAEAIIETRQAPANHALQLARALHAQQRHESGGNTPSRLNPSQSSLLLTPAPISQPHVGTAFTPAQTAMLQNRVKLMNATHAVSAGRSALPQNGLVRQPLSATNTSPSFATLNSTPLSNGSSSSSAGGSQGSDGASKTMSNGMSSPVDQSTSTHVNSPARPKSQPQAPMALPSVNNFSNSMTFNMYQGTNGQPQPNAQNSYVSHPPSNGQSASFPRDPVPIKNGFQNSQPNGARPMAPPSSSSFNGLSMSGMPANMSLKMPTRPQWRNLDGSNGNGSQNGASASGGGISPQASGRASPNRLPNASPASNGGRHSPMNGPDNYGNHRATPSPLSNNNSQMLHFSPHLSPSAPSPAHQHQAMTNSSPTMSAS